MKIISLLFGIILFLSFPKNSFGADIDITCNNDSCTPNSVPSFFPSSLIWYPGNNYLKTVKVQNNGTFAINVSVRAQNPSSTGDLDTVMDMVIYDMEQETVYYNNKLHHFYSSLPLSLSTIPISSSREYNFDFTMNTAAGNEFQGKTTSFDLVFNFSENAISPTSTPTNTPVPNPTDTPIPTSTPLPGPTETPGPGPTSTPGPSSNTINPTSTPIPLYNPFFAPLAIVIPTVTEEVLGGEITPTPIPEGGVLGSTQTNGLSSCRNSFWWFLLLAIQMTVNLSIIKRVPKKWASFTNILILGVNTVSALLFWRYFCTKNYLLLSFIFGMLSFYLHLRKVRRKRFQKTYTSYIYPEIRLPHAAI